MRDLAQDRNPAFIANETPIQHKVKASLGIGAKEGFLKGGPMMHIQSFAIPEFLWLKNISHFRL